MTIEELKVVITASVEGLKSSVQEAKKQLNELNGAANNTGKSVNENLNTKATGLKQSLIEQKRELEDLTLKLRRLRLEYSQFMKEMYRPFMKDLNFANQWGITPEQVDPKWKGVNVADIQGTYNSYSDQMSGLNAQQMELKEHVVQTRREYEDTVAKIKEMKTALGTTKKDITGIHKALNGITSIFKRMLIRKALMAIISQVRESLDLLARFDNDLGNTLKYNQALSDLKSSFKQLGANVSILVAELIVGLEPALQVILNLVNGLSIHVGKLLAALNGKDTYTYANPEYWKNYAKEVEAADKSNRKLLGGFDELNTLTSSNNYSTINPEDLYKTEELTGLLKVISNISGENGVLGKLALAFAGVYSVAKLLNKLFGTKNSTLSEQTDLTGKETSAAWALVPAFAAVAAGAAALKEKLENLPSYIPELQPQINLQPAYSQLDGLQEKANGLQLQPALNLGLITAGITTIISLIRGTVLPALVPSIDFSPVTEFVAKIKEKWNSIKLPTLNPNINTSIVISGLALMTSKIATFVSNSGSKLGQWATNFKTNVSSATSNAAQNIGTFVTGTAASIASWAKNTATNVRNTVSNWATNTYNSLSNVCSNINNWVTGTSSSIKNWCTSTAGNISAWASNVATNVGNALSSAWQNYKNFMTATGEKISGWWSQNKATIIPAAITAGVITAAILLAPYTGGASLGLAALANGGVIDSPTMALMGEYPGARSNPEIAAPESKIVSLLEANNEVLVGAWAQMTRQVIAAINDVDMTVSIGDDVIAKSAQRGNQSYKKMTGRPLIV